MSAGAVLAGLRIAAARLRGGLALATLLVSVAVALLIAALERGATPVGAADRALTAVFRFVVPIAAVVLSGQSTGLNSLERSAWPASRYGHARAAVGLGVVAAAALATAALSVVVALVALLAARAGADAGAAALPLSRDVVTTSWIALASGAAYSAWLGVAATWGRRGSGRLVFLGADLVVGGLSGAGAVFPRGLTSHLLGGEAPLGLPQAASSAILVATTGLCLALVVVRCRD